MIRTPPRFGPLRGHGRFEYAALHERVGFHWPDGRKLALYVGLALEHFAFGEGLGPTLAPSAPVDVLNGSWREYGNRVGVWRCLDLFDELGWPVGAFVNTALYDHCPQVVAAFAERGDELIAHGHTSAERQGAWPEDQERALLVHCRERMFEMHGTLPRGWLSPWTSESPVTVDLLHETGYRYTLNWCHDDQPVAMRTRRGGVLWSVPCPQELNDVTMILLRQMDAKDFAQMIVDQFDEMLEQTRRDEAPSLVMGVALHAYIVGQPFRLRHLRRALRHIAGQVGREVWITTPGAIVEALAGPA